MLIDDERISGLVDVFRSHADYQIWHEAQADALHKRWLVEQNLHLLTRRTGCLSGWSALCGSATGFEYQMPEPGNPIELREQLICQRTGLSARLRAGFQLGLKCLDDWPRAPVYLSEHASKPYVWLKQRLPRLRGSEYFSSEAQRQHVVAKLRYYDIPESPHFEDIMRLSFENRSFRLVLSFDVLEHVPDYRLALREVARVLKPGGHLVLTAPFMHDRYDTLIRASLDEHGEIQHHLSPEYHSESISDQGVLCYQTFGWDLLDACREAGFTDAAMTQPWDISQGLIGNLWTLLARR